jgi:hypothetical protein
MSSTESIDDPDVDLIFDFMIPTAGREVVDVSICSSGQNSLVIDVPVDWKDSHMERHTERLLHQEMRRFHQHLLWENSYRWLIGLLSGLSCRVLAQYATNRVNQRSRQLLSKRSDSTQRIWKLGRVSSGYEQFTLPAMVYISHLFVSQMLELANDKWSLLNHPNISPIWLLRSSMSAETIPAFAMPWFEHGNVLDFAYRHPHINKLNIVRLELPWFKFYSKLNSTCYKPTV